MTVTNSDVAEYSRAQRQSIGNNDLGSARAWPYGTRDLRRQAVQLHDLR